MNTVEKEIQFVALDVYRKWLIVLAALEETCRENSTRAELLNWRHAWDEPSVQSVPLDYVLDMHYFKTDLVAAVQADKLKVKKGSENTLKAILDLVKASKDAFAEFQRLISR